MDKRTVKSVLKFLEKGLIESGLNISKIILFGSHATAKTHLDSDIDVMIISEEFRNKDLMERLEAIREPTIRTIKKFVVPLDVATMTPEEFESESSPLAAYAREGKVMFSSEGEK